MLPQLTLPGAVACLAQLSFVLWWPNGASHALTAAELQEHRTAYAKYDRRLDRTIDHDFATGKHFHAGIETAAFLADPKHAMRPEQLKEHAGLFEIQLDCV